ncbi:MAG: hypothetical protein C0598_11865 [Marinilabiliales bacterium]|nr:MAG: hypothetical protein C0598_11865 [Marinilabiliales bacterium]
MKKIILSLFVILIYFSAFSQSDEGSRDVNEWSIIQSWDIPGKASGLAWDGTYLYFGIYGSDGDHFYKFNPSNGQTTLQFVNSSIGDCYGLTWDGAQLWTTDHVTSPSVPAEAIELTLSGSELSSFNLPDHYMSGIAYDAGNFWVGTYYPDPGTVYKVDGSGTIISQFTPPGQQIWDICKHGSNLWMVDYNDDMIYKTTQTGAVLESHPANNIKPAGIVYDGTYIWYVDGPLSSDSKLYKVSLTSSGTPEINIPVDTHDYGNVTIGTSETWQMFVQNTGTDDLVINGIDVPAGEPITVSIGFPQTISPGASMIIPIKYSPTDVEPLETTINVMSSDPINPGVDVMLFGHGVNSGPSLLVLEDTHNYNEVRMFAFTRWFMELVNIGDTDLSITELLSDNYGFIVEESTVLPMTISTLDTVKVGIWFNPSKEMTYNGIIQISSNDTANNPYDVTVTGWSELKNYPIGVDLWHYYITEGYDQSPKAIAPIQDITGDTVADVIVCSEDNFIRCFNGNSSGVADVMWEVEIYSGNVYQQAALEIVADINNDGYEDVIVGTTGGDRSIRAFSGKTGHPLWTHQTNEYGDGGWVYDINVTYDYNGDGIADVLAATGDDGQDQGPKRVYCLNVLDGLSIWEYSSYGPVFSVIGIEDVNNDGQADALAGSSSADETSGRIFGINGADGSLLFNKVPEGSSVWALAQLDDITGDNVKDLAAGDFAGNYYFINPVTQTYIYEGSINNSLILRFDKMEDINDDGYTDILPATSRQQAMIIDGYAGGNIWSRTLFDKAWNVAPIDDINEDGVQDVIVGTLFSDNYCYFLDGLTGDELESIDYSTPVDAINAIPDIARDGTMEMVAGGRNGRVVCYSGGVNIYVNVDENQDIKETGFSKNFPNPFADQTTISFNLTEDSKVIVDVIDLSGKRVKLLYDGQLSEGHHNYIWDGKDDGGGSLPPGFYLYEIHTDKATFRKKMAKIK